MKNLKGCLFFILLCYSFFVGAQENFVQVAGSPYTTGSSNIPLPWGVAYSPDLSGKLFAAVTNHHDNSISIYSVSEISGAFTEISGSPLQINSGLNPGPEAIAFSPIVSNNLFAAVANTGTSNVSIYSVDQTTGVFTEIPTGSPVPIGGKPESLAFSPIVSNNLFAAVVDSFFGNLFVYSVNQTTGVFTEVESHSIGGHPISVAFSPIVSNHLFAAVVQESMNKVVVYSVDPTSGAFTVVGSYATGGTPNSVAFSPNTSGTLFAAVANMGSENISVYSVDPTSGIFTEVAGSPFSADDQPFSIAFSLDVFGNLIAAATVNPPASFNGRVSAYTVDPTSGLFTEVTGSPFSAGQFALGIAFSPIVSNNLFAAVTDESGGKVFVYQVFPVPAVTEVSPNAGPTAGGTTVTITGINFTGATAVKFGSTDAISFTVDNNNQISATSPAGSGTVDVTVTTGNGTSATSSADQFTYFFPPTVTGVSPNAGPTSGGTPVTITGTNFTGATAVHFGSAAASFTINSMTQITAISPVGNGTVDVTVTTVGGTSATSSADQFTYVPLPPRPLKEFQKINKFATQMDIVNILTWEPPSQGKSSIVAYRIFRNKQLSELLAVISSEEPLKFKDHNRKKGKTYTYYIVSVDQFGNMSAPSEIRVVPIKEKEF